MYLYNRFSDIPQFTQYGSYQINQPIGRLQKWIDDTVSDYGMQLNPDFQRGHVWTEEQQVKYMEYLLKGGKSSRTIYFNYPSIHNFMENKDYNEFVCVDGLQRITAILKFINNELNVFGSLYKDFVDEIPFDVDVLININNLSSKKEVLQWYIEMNEGGTPHTNEEIMRVKKMMADV